MRSHDRRLILPLLQPHLPELAGQGSEGIARALNARTGLAIGAEVPNARAFDRWRQALAAHGFPVWGSASNGEG